MKLMSDTSFNLNVTQTIWQKKVKHHSTVESPDSYLSDLARTDHVVTQEDMMNDFPVSIPTVEFLEQFNSRIQDNQSHQYISRIDITSASC